MSMMDILVPTPWNDFEQFNDLSQPTAPQLAQETTRRYSRSAGVICWMVNF